MWYDSGMSEELTFQVADIDLKGHRGFFPQRSTEITVFAYGDGDMKYPISHSSFSCKNCDESCRLAFAENCTRLVITNDPCSDATYVPYKVKLEISSGKLAISDRLLVEIPNPDNKYFEIGSIKGRRDYAHDAEKHGLIRGYLYRSAIALLHEATNDIIIAELPLDEEEEDIIPDGYRVLGNINVDTWSYELMDAEVYLQIDAEKINHSRYNFDTLYIANVPNGVYEFIHYADDPEHPEYVDEDSTEMLIHAHGKYLG